MNIAKVTRGGYLSSIKDVNAPSKEVIHEIEEIKGNDAGVKNIAKFDDTLLRQVIDQIKSNFNMSDKQLHFRVNTRSNSVVVEVVDSKTNAVIRQIPSEEMQELKERIQEMTGALVDTKA